MQRNEACLYPIICHIFLKSFFSIDQDADVPDENDSGHFGASRPTGLQTYYTSRRRGRWKRNAGFGTSGTGCQQGSGEPSPGWK